MIKICVTVSGGVVTGVYSDHTREQVTAEVLDFDNLREEQGNGSFFERQEEERIGHEYPNQLC